MQVLIVEDDWGTRDVFRTVFRVHGFDVLDTDDGAVAVRMAREHVPDIILMDLSVRGCDGWEATRRLKEQAETAAIPVLALSGHVLPRYRARAQEVGCDGFIAKPADPSSVVLQVLRVLALRMAEG